MFLMHAVYGLGATISPLVSTEFVKRVGSRVYLFYAVSLGLASLTALALIVTFRFRTEDQVVGIREPDEPSADQATEMTLAPTQSTMVERPNLTDKTLPPLRTEDIKGEEPMQAEDQERNKIEHTGGSGGKMKRIMKTPVVHAMAFYIMVYVSDQQIPLWVPRLTKTQVGIEVTIGGWAVSDLFK